MNGLRIVEPSIQDRSDNTTRFLVMGRDPAEPSGKDSTWVVYTVTKTQPGTLHALLDPFASRGVNLGSIHSRPIPGKPWEYLFFLELEGHRDDPAVGGTPEVIDDGVRLRDCLWAVLGIEHVVLELLVVGIAITHPRANRIVEPWWEICEEVNRSIAISNCPEC